MALPFNGPISLIDIQTEFGGSSPQELHEYYRAGTHVPSNPTTMHIPTGSAGTTISLFDFYGSSNNATGNPTPATIYMTGNRSIRHLTSESRGNTKRYMFGKNITFTGSTTTYWSSNMDAYHGNTWGFYALSAGGGGSASGSKSSSGPLFGGSGGGGGSCLMVTHGMTFDKDREYRIDIGPPGEGGGSYNSNTFDQASTPGGVYQGNMRNGGNGGDIVISSSSGISGDHHSDNIIARVNGGTGGKAYYNGNTFVSQSGIGGTIPVQPVNSFIGRGGDGGVGKLASLNGSAAAFGGGGGGAGGFDATGGNQADGGDGGTNGGSGSQGNYGGAGGGASDATFSTYNGAYTYYTTSNNAYNTPGGYNSGGSSILPLQSANGEAWRRVKYDGTNPPYVDPHPPNYGDYNGFWSQASSSGSVTNFSLTTPYSNVTTDDRYRFENSAKYRHYQKSASNRNYSANWFSKFFLTGQYTNENLSPLTSGRDSRGAAGTNTSNVAMGGGGVYGGFSGADHRSYLSGLLPLTSNNGFFNAFGVGGGAPSNYFLSSGNNIGSAQPGMPGGPGMVVIWFSTNSTGTGGFKKLPYNEGTPI